MIEFTYNHFFFWLSRKRISLLIISFDQIFKFVTYYRHYKIKLGIIESRYYLFLFQQPPKLILLLYISYDYIIKIKKMACCESKASKHLYAVDYLYYKEKLLITNITYNPGLYYSSDKLKTIIFLNKPKASFVPLHAIQIVEFLPDDQILSNK